MARVGRHLTRTGSISHGHVLVALRRARGLTQEQVAERLGTRQQAIARLENPPYIGHGLSMVRRYMEALGAAIDVTTVPRERLTEYRSSDCAKPLLDGLRHKGVGA